jgi:hypothetical protein
MSQENEGNGTPELDKETQEILAELEAEGHDVLPPENSVPKPKEEVKPAESAPAEVKAPEKPAEKPADAPDGKPNGEEDGTKRDISYVPAYKLKVAESQFQKREKELLTQIETLSSGQKPTPEVKTDGDDTRPVSATAEAQAKALAEKHNISEELALDLVKLNPGQATLPPEVMEKLNALDDIKLERAAQEAQQAFSTEFDTVKDAIKAEYPYATDKELSQMKDRLFELAHSEQYHTVPLEEIFRGRSEFRGAIQPPTAGGEEQRGGSHVPTEIVDFANVSEEDIGKMDADTFEKYSDFMAKQEGKGR